LLLTRDALTLAQKIKMSIKQRQNIAIIGSQSEKTAAALHAAGVVLSDHTSTAGAVIIAESGVSAARTLAMQGIGRGQSIFSENPLLWGVCGDMLTRAASAQKLWLGMEGALLGSVPLAPFISTSQSAGFAAGFGGAAVKYLSRITNFRENPIAAEAQLKLLRTDMMDFTGKYTEARARIISALAFGSWSLPSTRQSTEGVISEDTSFLTRQGYTLTYGSLITPEGTHTGPLAMAQDMPTATLGGAWVADEKMETCLTTNASEETRATRGLLADIALWKQRAQWSLSARPFMSASPTRILSSDAPTPTPQTYLRASASCRTQFAANHVILTEFFNGEGSWQALVQGALSTEEQAQVLLSIGVCAKTSETQKLYAHA